MNEKTIKKLIRLVEESEIDQLEINSWGRKVKITRKLSGSNNGHLDGQAFTAFAPQPAAPTAVAPAPAPATTPVQEVQPPASSADTNSVEIKSPMVGTYYAAPAPDAPPYAKVGDRVSVGQVVCIVEAMKLMNEIESEVAGTITKVMAENAQPVEFGQVLFLINPE